MLTKLLALFMMLLSLGEATLTAYTTEMTLGGKLFLVNRTYTLSSDYEPNDLVTPKVKMTSAGVQMRAEAAYALEDMFAAAKEAGYTLYAVSGYRSYGQQASIYQRKIKNTGSVAKAQLLVAPPGASEHQLGLAMDLAINKSSGLTSKFGNTDEGRWVAENCWKYGYIIRYKEEWTEITGYAYEPWHIRYVGVEHAKLIHEADIPLETYLEQLRLARNELLAKEGSVALSTAE